MASVSYEGAVLADTYQLEARIGKGGMGVVYGARHTRLPRKFAIKILNAALAADDEQLQRFQSEAEIACSVAHNHVVEVFDFNRTDDGLAYIVMELLQGQDLAARILAEGCLSLRETAAILQQVADALEATHSRGIIHRDLKPPNLFLCSSDKQRDIVKVLDFGLAKLLQGQDRTQAGMVFGTPAYMAPEQAMAGFAQVGVRTDVWALGVILYECLTGKLAFAAKTAHETLHVICNQEPASLRSHSPDIPATVEAVVLKALRKRPEDRQQTVTELRDAFSQACESAWGRQVGSSEVVSQLSEASMVSTNIYVPDTFQKSGVSASEIAYAETEAGVQLPGENKGVLYPASDSEATSIRVPTVDQIDLEDAFTTTVAGAPVTDVEQTAILLGASVEPQMVAALGSAPRVQPTRGSNLKALAEETTLEISEASRNARIVGGVVALLVVALVATAVFTRESDSKPSSAVPSQGKAPAANYANKASVADSSTAVQPALTAESESRDAGEKHILATEVIDGGVREPMETTNPAKVSSAAPGDAKISSSPKKPPPSQATRDKRRAAAVVRKQRLRLQKKQEQEEKKAWDPNSSGLPGSE